MLKLPSFSRMTRNLTKLCGIHSSKVRLLPPTEGDDGLALWTSLWKQGDRLYPSFPMSHVCISSPKYPRKLWANYMNLQNYRVLVIIMDILMPSLFGLHCILGPAGVLPTLSLVESPADHGNRDICRMVPSLEDELGETPDVPA